MSVIETCLCGKKKNNLNLTNWGRHLSTCKSIKNKNSTSKYLTTYFKRISASSSSTESSESDAKKMKKTGKY